MTWRFGACELDLDRYELRRDGEVVALEPRAMQTLIHLVEHAGTVVTKPDLLDAVWGDQFVSESALTTQIKHLRKAVGDSGRAQEVIKTVHGRGYLFAADLESTAAATAGPDDDSDGQAPDGPTPAVGTMGEAESAAVTAAGRSNPVVAVLPFENLSPDPMRAHVADGLTSDILTALAKHRWLHVLPRAVVVGYGREPDAASRLVTDHGVDYLVEGTLRATDTRLRVTASLTATGENHVLWAHRFDRDVEDLFDVLDDVTDVIVATIEPEVGSAERARTERRPRTDLRAWDLFHLGIAHFYRFTAEDNLEAQRLLDEARRLDPDFGDAQAWWAYAVVLGMTYWETDPEPDRLAEALAATHEALSADDHNAVFHMLRGRVQLARREYGAALKDNQAAIALNPTFAAAYCGLGDSLSYEGRYDEAITQFSRAVELGAHDPQRWAFLSYGALALLFAGRYEEALEWADEAAALPNCQYWTAAHRVVALAHLEREDAWAGAVARLLDQCPHFTVAYARDKLFYLKRSEQLDQYLDGLTRAGVPTD